MCTAAGYVIAGGESEENLKIMRLFEILMALTTSAGFSFGLQKIAFQQRQCGLPKPFIDANDVAFSMFNKTYGYAAVKRQKWSERSDAVNVAISRRLIGSIFPVVFNGKRKAAL